MRQVAVVDRIGHALAGVEADDVDVDAEMRTDFGGNLLQRQQTPPSRHAALDGRDALDTKPGGQLRRVVDAVGIGRVVGQDGPFHAQVE